MFKPWWKVCQEIAISNLWRQRLINYCLNTHIHTSRTSDPEQKRQRLRVFFCFFFTTASLPLFLLSFHCQIEGLSFHASPWDFSNSLNICISRRFTAGKIFALHYSMILPNIKDSQFQMLPSTCPVTLHLSPPCIPPRKNNHLTECWCLEFVWISRVQKSGSVPFMLPEQDKLTWPFDLQKTPLLPPHTNSQRNTQVWIQLQSRQCCRARKERKWNWKHNKPDLASMI